MPNTIVSNHTEGSFYPISIGIGADPGTIHLYTKDGTAKSGLDYKPVNFTTTISNSYLNYNIETIQDYTAEGQENFYVFADVTFTNIIGGRTYVSQSTYSWEIQLVDGRGRSTCSIDLNSDGIKGPVDLSLSNVRTQIDSIYDKISATSDNIGLLNQRLAGLQSEYRAEILLTGLNVTKAAGEWATTLLGGEVGAAIGLLGWGAQTIDPQQQAPGMVDYLSAIAGEGGKVISSVAQLVARINTGVNLAGELLPSRINEIASLRSEIDSIQSKIQTTETQYAGLKEDLNKLTDCARAVSPIKLSDAIVGNADIRSNSVTRLGSDGNDSAYYAIGANKSTVISTGAGDDRLVIDLNPTANSSLTVLGGSGHDVVRINASARDFTGTSVGSSSFGAHSNLDSGASLAFHDVERLVFNDIVLALDVQGNAGKVYRLYQAAFDRAPDKGGISAHVSAVDHGFSLHDDAASFISSPEFAQRYGASPTNEAFVTALYQNVLHRAPDAAGATNWLNQLRAGVMDRASVLVGFSESQENHNQVDPKIASGIQLDYGLFS